MNGHLPESYQRTYYISVKLSSIMCAPDIGSINITPYSSEIMSSLANLYN